MRLEKLGVGAVRSRWIRARGGLLFELCIGLTLFAIAGGVLRLSARLIQTAAPQAARAVEKPSFLSGQSPRPSEPAAMLGPRYDEDSSLPQHAAEVVRYRLDARLDDASHEITGRGQIVWTNASTEPATELYLHLYLNAFKNSKSLFLRSPFGASRTGRKAVDWGYIDVRKLAWREQGGVDLWKNAERHTPGDPDDQTDIRVPLPQAVEPGKSMTLDVEWLSKLPTIVERTGYAGDFYLVAQWFPKIARREPNGAWVHFPFHAYSEFYADYGSYDVSIDVPASMVVGATGVLTSTRMTGGRKVLQYRMGDVHDFAWTAWSRFRERRQTVDGVAVRILYPPGNFRNAEVTLAAVRHGLRSFGKAYGRYPYPVLTVVHPPENAVGADGMEYPTLISTGGPWYAGPLSTFVERVTLHELGHQWFYGLVATDEHSWPFLDEGLTSYAESRAMRELFGDASGLRLPGIRIDGDAYARMLSASAGHHDIVAVPAANFTSFHDLGALVYARTSTILETLARTYGEQRVTRALGRYARRYRFEHPEPKHLLAAVREVLGDDAEAFLRAALFEGGWVDYVAQSPTSTPVAPRAGIFDTSPSGRQTITSTDERSNRYRNRALVYRYGTLSLPVDIELVFDNGQRLRKRWDGNSRWTAIDQESSSPLVSVLVDPELAIPLDDNLMNNAARATRDSPSRTIERALYAAEIALGALGP